MCTLNKYSGLNWFCCTFCKRNDRVGHRAQIILFGIYRTVIDQKIVLPCKISKKLTFLTVLKNMIKREEH